MNALSSQQLKMEQLDDDVQFTLTREKGWLERVLVPAGVVAVLVYGIVGQSLFILIAGAVVLVRVLMGWTQGPVTLLRVSESRLLASGNLGKMSDGDLTISAREVASIGWWSGGRNRPSGLYAWHGMEWVKASCLLPGLSEKNGREAEAAIRERFPQYKIGVAGAISFTFSAGSPD